MNPIIYFEQKVKVANTHSERIEEAFECLQSVRPITLSFMKTITFDQRNCLEMALHRFAKLQNLLGDKIFPLLMIFMNKDNKKQSYIDQLNILEKMELLPSRLEWIEMRKLQNKIAHNYPCDPMTTVQETNDALDAAQKLVNYWHTLLPKIKKLLICIKKSIASINVSSTQ